MVVVFTPWKLANNANQGLFIYLYSGDLVKHLPALSDEVIFEQRPELDVGIVLRISGGEQYRHWPQTSPCLT